MRRILTSRESAPPAEPRQTRRWACSGDGSMPTGTSAMLQDFLGWRIWPDCPARVSRDERPWRSVDRTTVGLSLFHFDHCPHMVMARSGAFTVSRHLTRKGQSLILLISQLIMPFGDVCKQPHSQYRVAVAEPLERRFATQSRLSSRRMCNVDF